MFLDILIPVITLIIGAVGGFFIASKVMKQQFEKMQSDPKQIQALAKSMGVNMNQKQLNNLTRQMNSSKKNTPKKKK